jgi:hypothetical protein
MFKIKPMSFNAMITPKPPKTKNVLVNVVVIVTIHNQQLKHVFKERESIKAKGAEDWQQKKHIRDSFIENVKHLQNGGIVKQPTIINEESLQMN